MPRMVGTGPQSSLFSAQHAKATRAGARNSALEGSEEAVEKENEAILGALHGEMERLKRTATGMRDDVREHNRLIDSLTSVFDRATSGVKKSVSSLDQTMKKYGFKHTVYIAVAFVVVLILLYYMVSAMLRTAPAPTPAPSGGLVSK
jgi:hypothetical protein